MDLILHIGTHKTASTSLQHFFTLNRDVLRRNGIHYPSNATTSDDFDYLASDLVNGRRNSVFNFIQKSKGDAERYKCHAILISAEALYAMTAFFLEIYNRLPEGADYWDVELQLINDLKGCCLGFNSVCIICYVRPQDEYAGSVYNQMVKGAIGTPLSYYDFITKLKPIFDYYRHLSLWENAFGVRSVQVLRFDDVGGNIIENFCNQFLTPACFEQASRSNFHSNTRLSRNVLEVKRSFNAVEPGRAYDFVAAAVFRNLSDRYPDSKGYQVFGEPDVQREFFSIFEEGNRALSADNGFSTSLPTVTQGEPGYPGLSTTLGLEITMRFLYEMALPRRRIEIALRRLSRFVQKKIPGGRWIVLPAQMVLRRIRLKQLDA